jgi:hypothetical protein
VIDISHPMLGKDRGRRREEDCRAGNLQRYDCAIWMADCLQKEAFVHCKLRWTMLDASLRMVRSMSQPQRRGDEDILFSMFGVCVVCLVHENSRLALLVPTGRINVIHSYFWLLSDGGGSK